MIYCEKTKKVFVEGEPQQIGHGSSVCSVSASEAAVLRSTLASGTFFCGQNFPLLLIKKSNLSVTFKRMNT